VIDHPYKDRQGEQWLRGNLHTHTTRSDGSRDVQTVIDDYAARGYDYLMISDHDIYTSVEDHAGWNSRGMVLLSGNEITRNGPHLLHVGADSFVAPSEDRQAVIDEVNAGAGFVIVNHPDWQPGFDHCSLERLRAWSDYEGIEIYNGVIGRLDGSPYALQKWETLLSEGRRVWGYANDDSHIAQDAAMGWNVVSVKERSRRAILEALRAGRFYASTGVEITGINVEDGRIRIETSNAERIVGHSLWGHRFAVADDTFIEVEVPENTPYVRFTCWGPGEKFAWTQPFYV
jgi:hypothetical protein